MNTQIKRNAEPIKPTNSFDDDTSCISKSSLDAVKLLLQEPTSLEGKMTIDIAEKDNFDALDDLLEPLEDIDEELPEINETNLEEPPSFQNLPTCISQDSSSLEEMTVPLEDDDISTLMKAELIEPVVLPPFKTRLEQEAPAVDYHPDVISRILTYLYHTEPDRRVFYRADEIVRECRMHHQRGDRKYKNYPGAVFERFVKLFGGPKFHEIYHRSQGVDPRLYMQSHTSTFTGSALVQLAMAYGIHLARTNASEPNSGLVRHGVETLKSMTETEKHMFWNFIMKQGS